MQNSYESQYDEPAETRQFETFDNPESDMVTKQFFWKRPEKTETQVEVAERLEKLGVSDVNLEGVLDGWQEKLADSVEDMCEKYPELVGKIGKISSKKLPDGVFACAGPSMNAERGFSSDLQVSSDFFSKGNLEWKVVDLEKENMFGERWLAGQGVDGVVKHELGHLLHLQMIANEEGLDIGEYDEAKFRQVYERYAHNSIVCNMAVDSMHELGISANDAGRELSAYGKRDFGEFFAEAISECESKKNPRPLALKVKEKYNQYMQERA